MELQCEIYRANLTVPIVFHDMMALLRDISALRLLFRRYDLV